MQLKSKMKGESASELWTSLIILAIVVLCTLLVDVYSCHSKWGGSGMGISYGPLKGCTIKNEKGQWIPAENYRDIP